jgi:hypothetical protein
MRIARFFALTFLFFLLLLGFQVLVVCLVFIALMLRSTSHATGVGFVAGGMGRSLALLEIPMALLAAVCAWWSERYWGRRAAKEQPETRAPLL